MKPAGDFYLVDEEKLNYENESKIQEVNMT